MNAEVSHTEVVRKDSGENFLGRKITRLAFLKQVGLLTGAFATGCSPMRILFKAYPGKYDTDEQLVDQILRAFVTTVIPGAPVDDPDLTRIYSDNYYPFYRYRSFFVSDLAERSEDLFGDERFDRLSLEQRTAVIEDGLAADGTLKQLYTGAIFMAQVSFYGSIYDDDKGCSSIDFQGSNSGFTPEEMCYPNGSLARAKEITSDGNYA